MHLENILKRYPLRGLRNMNVCILDCTQSIYMVQQTSSETRSTPAATHGVRKKLLFSLQLCPLATAHTLHISKSCKNHANGVPGNFISFGGYVLLAALDALVSCLWRTLFTQTSRLARGQVSKRLSDHHAAIPCTRRTSLFVRLQTVRHLRDKTISTLTCS